MPVMIYLDHNATTPVHPAVIEAMVPYFREGFGNASSFYKIGRDAKAVLEDSRNTVAACIGAETQEIIFTSGGTESDNLAIRGVAGAMQKKGRHIITSCIEHHAVLKTCYDLEREGFSVTYLPVDAQGLVDPDDVQRYIRKDTILITIMLANNETGVIEPVAEIGRIARANGVVFHTDAVQAVGKIPVNVNELFVDLLSLSAHKIYGPKGIGALFVKKGTPLIPILTGGHHENNLRAGTENIPFIAGMAKALSIAVEDMERLSKMLSKLRNRLELAIIEKIKHVQVNGADAPRVPHTTNISFLGIEGESILLHLDLRGIYASSGSACTTGSPEASHVLLAMGVAPQTAQGSIRFSLGQDNTAEQVDETVDALVEITTKLRAISSLKAG